MKKFFIALEEVNEEVIVDPTPDVTVEESIEQAETEDNSIQQQKDVIEEADSTLEATNAIEETIETVVEEQDGLDKTSTVITAASLEHFYERFNFKTKEVLKISNENFKSKETRLETSKVILENLKDFNKKLNKQINIAKEGLGRRFANSIKMIFTAEKKISVRLTEDVQKAKTSTVKLDTIVEPGWGRSFAVISTDTVSGSDVIKFMSSLDNLFKHDLEKYVEKINTVLNKITSELKRGGGESSNEKSYKELLKITEEIEKFDESFKVKYGILTTKKADPDFKPLTTDEIIKLGNTTLSVLNNTEVNKAFDELFDTTWNNWIEVYNNTKHRDDIVANMSKVGMQRLANVIDTFYMTMLERKRICFAASNYIKASIA